MRRIHRYLTLIVLGQMALAQMLLGSLRVDYPQTPIDPVVDSLHGIEVVDPFRWLEDGQDPRVAQWTVEQNQFTRAYLDEAREKCTVRERLAALYRHDTYSFVDVPLSERRFVWRKQHDQEQHVLSWQEDPAGEEQRLIDPNLWAPGLQLEYAAPSPNGTYVAYGVSRDGDESPVIRVLHVDSGKHLSDYAKGRCQGWLSDKVWWLPDNSGFYYTALDKLSGEEHLTSVVYFHRLGTLGEEDEYVFGHGAHREYIVELQLSDSGRWILFDERHQTGNVALYLQSLDEPNAPKTLLVSGRDSSLIASFAGDNLVLVTDQDAPHFKAYLIDPTLPQPDYWAELIPESEETLVNVKPVGGQYYAEYLSHAHTIVKLFGPHGDYLRMVPLSEMGTATVLGLWNKAEVWIDFTSFAHPKSRYAYDVETDILTPVLDRPSLFDSSRYHVEQVWYPSKDGTMVSMFLIGEQNHGTESRPTLLTGYGGFGISITPHFKSTYLPFIEAGGLVAVPNLRGGGEYGRVWHQQGMKENKQNVFDDFIASAEWLIAQGYTTSEQLAISGRSNGGLLVGAAMTQRPDLFRAVLCEVPLLDMVRYHQFGFSNIWAGEYGSADNQEQFPYLFRYSPYHCVKEGVNYPAVLVRGASNDARTDALHARKMIARLQMAEPDGLPKLLLVDEGAGHLGGSTLSQTISQNVDSLVFIMDQLGMITFPKPES